MDDMSFHWPRTEPAKLGHVTMTVAEARALFDAIDDESGCEVFEEVLDKAQGDVVVDHPPGEPSYILVKITAT